MRRPRRLPATPSKLRPPIVISPLIADAFVAPRAGLSGTNAVHQLAEDMRQAGHREGGVSAADLELLGWTAQQLAQHAAAARVLAQSLAGMGV